MTKETTITEALAELKTLDSRISTTEQFILNYAVRQGSTIDPLQGDGGSDVVIPSKLQSLADLLERKVAIRDAINLKNQHTMVEIAGISRTVAQWIIWRRETFKREITAYQKLQTKILDSRRQCVEKGLNLKEGEQPTSVQEVASFIPESEINTKIEQLREIESTLDGKLSLINAVTTVII